jgi:hypothetical protein
MDLVKKKMVGSLSEKAKVEIDTNEEGLHEVYQVSVNKEENSVKSILVGVDGGSTQSRVTIMDEDDGQEALEEIYAIPSPHATLTGTEIIEPQSEKLRDNLDSIIIPKKNGLESNVLFDTVRVLRTTKLTSANKSEDRISSKKQKINTSSFYINIIDSIAYALIQKYKGKLERTYEVYAGVSLPPDDTTVLNKEVFLKRLVNSYTWKSEVYGIEIVIDIKAAAIQTEPEGALKAYLAMKERDLPEYALGLDGGGRSSGVDILINGVSQSNAATAFKYGGTQLAMNLGQAYRDKFGGGEIDIAILSKALKTGTIKKGTNIIDISDLVIKVQDDFARTLYNSLSIEVFDKVVNMSLDQIELIVLSGRLFNNSVFPKLDEKDSIEDPKATPRPDSYSVVIPLSKLIKADLPEVEIVTLEDNYIPAGNLIKAFTEYSGYVFSDEEEVEAEVASDEVTDSISLDLDSKSVEVESKDLQE